MPSNVFIGEFEQLVLLALLRLGEKAYALPAREELGRTVGRPVSRGAFYRTLDRLRAKGYLTWDVEDEAPRRGGHARRRFTVSREGIDALRRSRRALHELWTGLDEVLG